ncbi:MAG: hypothetical protein CMP07_10690 [Xanthomonadales bacterium]|nr:hypothetical protein [Xanthomonadales bacterium]|tara:strand:- start:376 stop:960 length:585 start_codon:yes stop_codon:yes gene_type:complete
MNKISRETLLPLERYAEQRDSIRAEVMAHKKKRRVPVGEHLTLYFEDEMTMRYQVQEMLRIEKLFEPGEIEDELAAYNPLIPDGANWKATVMIEYSDEAERRRRLAELKGIENTLHIQVEGFDPVYAIVNEDMERSNDDKTSAVHFARFEFTPEMIEAMKSGAKITAGVRHDAYPEGPVEITGEVRDNLVADFA